MKRGPADVLDHATSEIASGSKLGIVTKIIRLASRRICRNRVAVVPVSPRSPKVGAGAPTFRIGVVA